MVILELMFVLVLMVVVAIMNVPFVIVFVVVRMTVGMIVTVSVFPGRVIRACHSCSCAMRVGMVF